MSHYANCTEVTISDIARLTFYEIINGERTEIISLVMRPEHLMDINMTITQVLNQYKAGLK